MSGWQRVLITGAAGRIGSVLREGLRGAYPVLRLSDIAPLGAAAPGEELHPADLRHMGQVEAMMEGVDLFEIRAPHQSGPEHVEMPLEAMRVRFRLWRSDDERICRNICAEGR